MTNDGWTIRVSETVRENEEDEEIARKMVDSLKTVCVCVRAHTYVSANTRIAAPSIETSQ